MENAFALMFHFTVRVIFNCIATFINLFVAIFKLIIKRK